MGRISEKDIFAFREARERDGAKPSTVNRDFRTLRAALKKARPDYHFPRRGHGRLQHARRAVGKDRARLRRQCTQSGLHLGKARQG